jgi:nitroimidazol reductase NimA-like FMN-containing flavoprotein (pyridoxamine 5'-phosphate oxidase superfamily)
MSTTDHPAEAQTTRLVVIPREECLALIARGGVGRLAVALPHRSPLIVPVNYVVEGEAVLFRTDAGSKLDALRTLPVSFEVDEIDPFHKTGWSVLIRGFAHLVSPAMTDLEAWAPGAKAQWVRVQAVEISGRRIVEPDLGFELGGYL